MFYNGLTTTRGLAQGSWLKSHTVVTQISYGTKLRFGVSKKARSALLAAATGSRRFGFPFGLLLCFPSSPYCFLGLLRLRGGGKLVSTLVSFGSLFHWIPA